MVSLVFWLFLALVACKTQTQAVVFVATPECPYTGHATCADGIDNDADGTVDEAAPGAAFVADGVNYRANFSNGQMVSYTTVTDPTFASGNYVGKDPTLAHYVGEIALSGNFTKGTYEILLYYSLPVGPTFAWFKTGSSHGEQVDNANAATVLAAMNTPGWANNTQPISKTGSLSNAYARVNSADSLTVALDGNGVVYVKSEGGLRLGCIYLRLVGNTTDPTCPGETGSGDPGHYAVYKLSGSAPTSCADAQFTNANIWNWVGSSTTTDAAPNLKILHDATKFYTCQTITDNDLRATTSTADVFPSADDRFEFSWRDSTATTPRDATTFKFVTNPLTALYSANYTGGSATVSQSLSESCSVTLNGDLDSTADDTSWQMFCSFNAGFTLTDGMKIRGEVHVSDTDGTGTSSRTGFGSTINDPANWPILDILAATVPGGGGDVTAPVVTTPAVPSGSVEEASAVMTAATNEAGTCRTHYGIATKTYTKETAGSASANGQCTESLGTGGGGSQTDPLLTGSTTYYAVMKVTDAAGNIGTSSEVSFTTDAPAPPTCTHYAGPTTAGAADGSSNANRFLIASFWPVAKAGSSLCLADGEYTGTNSMIVPPSGKKGSALAPIKISGTNDGGARLNGQGARRPIVLGNDNDWFIIERLDAHNSGPSSSDGVVEIYNNSDNNIIRRVVAWDCPLTGNCTVVSVNGGVNNLIEDVAAFGTGRKMFSSSQSGNSNTKFRRVWFAWTKTQATNPPKMGLSAWYNSYGTIYDNPIGTWHEESGSIVTAYNNGIFGSDHFQAYPTLSGSCANAGIFGGIAYIRGSDTITTQPTGGEMMGTVWMGQQGHCTTLRDIVSYVEPTTHTAIKSADLRNLTASYGGPLTSSTSGNSLTRSTFIGGAAPSIGSSWLQSGNEDVATVGAASNIWNGGGASGARVCKRYNNGTITTTPLWPWPMDARISAALTASGRTPSNYFRGSGNTVTSEMETIFGTIPAECRS